MRNARVYLKKHPTALIILLIYCFCWSSLLTPFAIIIGEFPVAPMIAIPYCVVMLANAIFREEQRLFYLSVAVIVVIPFFIISILAGL
jgi:hypothetical protein